MGGFKDWFWGSDDKYKKLENGSPEQLGFHKDILSQLQQMMNPGGGYSQAQDYYKSLLQPGNQAYENFAAPFMNQFQEQTIPGIEERYAKNGALSSSGFGQALGGAGAGLQAQLAQLFASLQSQAAGAQTHQFNQMGQTGLNYQPFSYDKQEGSAGMFGPLLTSGVTALGGPLAGLATSGISSYFNRKPSLQSGLGAQSANLAGMMNLMR